MFKNISTPLQHLSMAEIETLIQRYQRGEKVKTLIEEYQLELVPSNFVRNLPMLLAEHIQCPYCLKSMYEKVLAKQSCYDAMFVCADCDHTSKWRGNNEYLCDCSACENARFIAEQAEFMLEKQRIKERYNLEQYQPVSFNELTILEKCFLYSWYLLAADLQCNHLMPLRELKGGMQLTMSNALTQTLVKQLVHKSVLVISPETEPNAFYGQDGSQASLQYVAWCVNLTDESGTRLCLAEIGSFLYQEISQFNLSSQRDELLEIIKQLQLEELLMYLEARLDKYGLPQAPARSKEVLLDMLNDISVSSCLYFIKKACDE